MKKYQGVLIGLLFLIVQIASAQNGKLKMANKQFENMSYIDAIRFYEEYLPVAKEGSPEMKEALTKVAFCYRKVQDSRNAERVYAELIKHYGNETESETYLYYAQALANNRKYKESQKMYSKYGEQQAADMRGRRFTVAYMDNSRFFQDSAQYHVEYVYPLNSRQADFSPMYYKNGLVFVTSRDEGGAIKRVFMQNQTPFLDLYWHPDTALLHKENYASIKNQGSAIGGGSSTSMASEQIEKEEKSLTKVETFSRTLNSKYHEGPVTFFKDYKKIIFTRNNYSKGKYKTSTEGVNKLKLYIASNDGKKWMDIRELPFNSDEYSCGHPALSPDNTKLYFVSDMPGGFGGTDVYVVEYRDGKWGTPLNMGKEINTEGNEMFPYVDENGNLYFSSDGQEGLGGLDIFYVEMKDGTPISNVQNVGSPLNSEKDDFGIITDGKRQTGYFSSNRKRGYSDDNIYYFRHSCRQLNIKVFDASTKEPMSNTNVRIIKNGVNKELLITGSDGKISVCLEAGTEFEFKASKEGYMGNSVAYGTLSHKESNKTSISIYLEKSKAPLVRGTIKSELNQQPLEGATVTLHNEKDGSTVSVVTGADGQYEFQPTKEGEYSVTAIKEPFAVNTENVGKLKQTKKSPKVVNTDLGMVGQGEIYKLENIYYDYGQSYIRPDAARELNERIIPLLKKYPTMQIEIRSHTDSRSSDAFNIKLSENRAKAVVNYLVLKGVESTRMEAKGYGEKELLNDCKDGVTCTENEHQINRRTEFKIVSVQ